MYKFVLQMISIMLLCIIFNVQRHLSIVHKSLHYLIIGCLLYIVFEYWMVTHAGSMPMFIYDLPAFRKDASFISSHKYAINGPIFGAQFASVLSTIALLYLFYSCRGFARIIMTSLSLFCFYVTFTITGAICLFSAICVLLLSYKGKGLILCILIALTCLFFPVIGNFSIYLKLGKDPGIGIFHYFDYYIHIGMIQLADVGKVLWKLPFGSLLPAKYVGFSDIDCVMFVLRYGYIFAIVFYSAVICSIIRLTKYVRETNDNRIRGIIAYLIVLVVSTIHYPSLTNIGLSHFFIAFLSIGLSSSLIRPFPLSGQLRVGMNGGGARLRKSPPKIAVIME